MPGGAGQNQIGRGEGVRGEGGEGGREEGLR